MKVTSLKEYYRLGNYDPGGGFGKLGPPSEILGSQTAGQEKIKHIYDLAKDDSSDKIFTYLDTITNQIN